MNKDNVWRCCFSQMFAAWLIVFTESCKPGKILFTPPVTPTVCVLAITLKKSAQIHSESGYLRCLLIRGRNGRSGGDVQTCVVSGLIPSLFQDHARAVWWNRADTASIQLTYGVYDVKLKCRVISFWFCRNLPKPKRAHKTHHGCLLLSVYPVPCW